MKNLLKIGVLGLILAAAVTACDPPQKGSEKIPVDSNKAAIDTLSKVSDSAKNMLPDSSKTDSVKK